MSEATFERRVSAALLRVFGDARLDALSEITSGASGVTLLGSMASKDGLFDLVVKTIPAGLSAIGHRDLRRQVHVLGVLDRNSSVPVPRVLAFDPGDPPAYAPFYVMSRVAGDSFDPTSVASGQGTPCEAGMVTERALATIRVLAALQTLDTASLDGEVTDLSAELARWERAFATTSGAHRLLADALSSGLRATQPAELGPTLVHGDFRLGNLLYDGVVPTAVLDWEIWSKGDPRLDLAWLVGRAQVGHPWRPDDAAGFPPAAVLLAEYTQASGMIPTDFEWFVAAAAFKHAAAGALLAKRQGSSGATVTTLLQWGLTQLR